MIITAAVFVKSFCENFLLTNEIEYVLYICIQYTISFQIELFVFIQSVECFQHIQYYRFITD